MTDWKTKSSEIVYETPWIRVRRNEVLNHRSKPLTYSIVELRHPSVFIVAVNKAGQICLLKNYRYTVNMTMQELPAGYSDGQDFLMAAKRELLEETGLKSDDWAKLSTLYQANGIGNIPFVVFLARNVRHASDERDEEEDISEQTFIDFVEIEDMIAKGEIIESAHIAALYLAKLHGITKEKLV